MGLLQFMGIVFGGIIYSVVNMVGKRGDVFMIGGWGIVSG